AFLLDGLGEMSEQREGGFVLPDLLVPQVELGTAPGTPDDVGEGLVHERAVDLGSAAEHPPLEDPLAEELEPERMTAGQEQDALLVSASVLLQGVHEQSPLIDDGARGFRLTIRSADSLGLRLAGHVRELGQQLLRNVLVLLETLLPKTAEIESQHGRDFVLA